LSSAASRGSSLWNSGVLIGRIFVSPSIPFVEEATLVLLIYLIIAFFGALLSHSFLKEEKLVGR
jgi:hypothetical protein